MYFEYLKKADIDPQMFHSKVRLIFFSPFPLNSPTITVLLPLAP